MFTMIDPPVYEAPIEIDFNTWLRTRNTPAAHIPPVSVKITVCRTEWMGENDRDGKRPYEVTAQFVNTVMFADFLQELCPIAKVGVRGDVNNWYNLLNFATHEAIDWRREKAKG
jgi:hypothetical protein